MQFSLHAILFIVTNISGRVEADSFNYRYTSGDNYGPAEWNKVDCNGLEDCVSKEISVALKCSSMVELKLYSTCVIYI